jgi:4-hydroxy-tetrahydrodipicolinate synthase
MLQDNGFGSVLTAMVTPFDENGDLDIESARKLAKHLVDNGVDGLALTGTTGEISTITDDEHVILYEAIIDEVGDRAAILAGTSTNDTAHSVNLSKRAAAAGVDGLLLVTPYYNKPSQAGVQAHFETIANSVDLPIMLYDIPGRSVTEIETETLIALAQHPNIVALKDAKGNILETTRVLAQTNLKVYSGEDGLTLPLMAIGGTGIVSVSAHVAPREYRDMIDAAAAGDYETARKKHFELDPVQRAIMSHMQGAVAAKQVLAREGTIAHPTVRLPLVAPTDDEFAAVLKDLHESGRII